MYDIKKADIKPKDYESSSQERYFGYEFEISYRKLFMYDLLWKMLKAIEERIKEGSK